MKKYLLLFITAFLFSNSISSQTFADPLLITMNQEEGFEHIDLIVDDGRKFAVVEFLQHQIGDKIFFNDQEVFEFQKLYQTSLFNSSAIVFELSKTNEYIDHQVVVDSVNTFRNLKIRNGKVYYQVDDFIYTFNDEKIELFYDLQLINARFFDYDIRDNKIYIAGAFSDRQASMKIINQSIYNDIVQKSECKGEYSFEPNFYTCIDMNTDEIIYFFKEENKCFEAESAKMRIGPNGIFYAFSDHGETINIKDSIILFNEENEAFEKDSYLFRIDNDGNILNLQTYRNICEDNIHDVIPQKDSSYSVVNQVTECLYYDIQNNSVPAVIQSSFSNIYFAQYNPNGSYLWHHRVGKRFLFMPTNFLFNSENTFRIAFEIHKNINNNDRRYIYDDNIVQWDTFGVVKIYDFNIKTGELLDSSITIQNNHLVWMNDAVTHDMVSTYNLTFFDFAPSLLADSIPFENLPLNEEVIINIIYGMETNTNDIDFAKENISIYPNPIISDNQLYIDSDIHFDNYVIYDNLGRKIYTSPLSNNTIDFPDLAKGIYFISLFKEGILIANKKIIKV